MKIPYFPGCSLKTIGEGFEKSAIASAAVLDIELNELPRWVCCGTVSSLTTDDLMHHLAPVRNLIRVQDLEETQLVTLCSVCYSTLKRSNTLVKNDPEKLKTMNQFMYRESDYQCNVKVLHFLELLREIGFDKIKEKIKKPLRGLTLSPYYGCLLVRPKEFGIDDPEAPTILQELTKALGADVIDNPYQLKCCGSYHTVDKPNLVADLGYKILTYARNSGADALVLSCPLCAFNLDNRQREIKRQYPDFVEIPILYFTQLMALAFDLDEERLGFDIHYVDPVPLLKEKQLLIDSLPLIKEK